MKSAPQSTSDCPFRSLDEPRARTRDAPCKSGHFERAGELVGAVSPKARNGGFGPSCGPRIESLLSGLAARACNNGNEERWLRDQAPLPPPDHVGQPDPGRTPLIPASAKKAKEGMVRRPEASSRSRRRPNPRVGAHARKNWAQALHRTANKPPLRIAIHAGKFPDVHMMPAKLHV